MKIILVSVGTRGDMEPFLAIGRLLYSRGHEVLCAMPEKYRSLAEDSDIRFASLGTKFTELIESETGKLAMGGGRGKIQKLFAMVKLAVSQKEANKELLKRQFEIINTENPDTIVYHSKAIYPVIWATANPGRIVLVSPVPYLHYVEDHAHIAFNNNYGIWINKLTYKLAEFGLIKAIMIYVKMLDLSGKISQKIIIDVLHNQKVIYTVSPTLFRRPEYWPDRMKVLGYQERDSQINSTADDELATFIARHDKLLFVTFGSMINPKPTQKTKILMDVLNELKVAAIFNIAGGGLLEPESYDRQRFFFVSGIPYEWIFPKVYAVIHHGGSGTTHLALKYGCATMIIPHIIDQFVWAKIIVELGVGPKGVKIGRISRQNLKPKIKDLMTSNSYKSRAAEIGQQMISENFADEIYSAIVDEPNC